MSGFKCRICGGGVENVFKAMTPLAAKVTNEPDIEMRRYPIRVAKCKKCGHIQLRDSFDTSLYSEYLYTPSYASGFISYIEAFVDRLSNEINKKERKVIEIGSGNGYLLGKLKEKGWEVLGVEPSEPLSNSANKRGIKTYCGFFSIKTVDNIREIFGQPDVIIIRHVMEHLEDLNDVIKAVSGLIGDGVLLVEVPYLKRIINEDQFYAFFHEHLHYFSVTSLSNILNTGEVFIHKVYENDLEGGSILIYADKKNNLSIDDNVSTYLEDEQESLSDVVIEGFFSRINSCISNLNRIVKNAITDGKLVAGWGAGQRGCTLIGECNYQSSDIKYVVDVNKNYWHKYIPGTDIEIVPPSYYIDNHVDKIIIFATGYADSIISENQAFINTGCEFIRII